MNDTERARLIAVLTHLKVPFDRKQISKLPASAGRPALDYVNHAHVTARLNAQAEDWTYTVDEQFGHGGQFWIRGTMTICGVSRVEYGQGKNPLEAASHFVRRAAMRFGVAVDLWAKEDLEDSWGTATVPQVAPDASLAATSGAERSAAGEAPRQRVAGDGTPHTPAAEQRPPAEYGEGSPGGTTSGGVEPDRVVAPAPPPDEPDHEPEWGPSPRANLAAKGWKVCTYPGCEAPQHSPRIIKDVA